MKQIEPGYFIQKSTRKNKKYDIYKNNKYLLSFGDSRYEHYKDSTPLKAWSSLDHNDKERRRLYFARHGHTTNRNTAKYFSNKFLW